MAKEKTFVMIKPDGVQRGLVGEVISRFERKGLQLVALKMIQIDRDLAGTHYAVHKERPFFGELIDFVTASPVIVSVWEGESAIAIVRKLVGATKALDAEPGTIRGDLVINTTTNIIHASDGLETAESEVKLFFKPEELVSYDLTVAKWFS